MKIIPIAYAQTQNWQTISPQCVEGDVATIQGISCLIANILSVATSLIGIVAFIMMVVGGFKWLLSGGNQQQVESARNTMTFAVIGLVVALSAFIILNLISSFTGVESILNISIPDSTKNW